MCVFICFISDKLSSVASPLPKVRPKAATEDDDEDDTADDTEVPERQGCDFCYDDYEQPPGDPTDSAEELDVEQLLPESFQEETTEGSTVPILVTRSL